MEELQELFGENTLSYEDFTKAVELNKLMEVFYD